MGRDEPLRVSSGILRMGNGAEEIFMITLRLSALLRLFRQMTRVSSPAPEMDSTIQSSGGQALRWLNFFHILAHGSAAPVTALCLFPAHPLYSVLLCASVLIVLAVYNVIFYAVPADKTTAAPCSHILRFLNFLLGVCWATLPIMIFPYGNSDDRVLVSGITIGLTATTVSLLPLRMAGELISSMIMIGCWIALFLTWEKKHSVFYLFVGIELFIYLFFILSLSATVRFLFIAFLTNRRSLEERNSIVQLLLRNADNEAGDWLWDISADGTLQNVSTVLANALGRSIPALEGRSLVEVLAEINPPAKENGRNTDLLRLEQCLGNRIFFRDIVVGGFLDSRQHFWSLSGRPIFQNRIFMGYRGVGTDVTQTHRARESASFRARHDILTGLPNRAAFMDDMETYLIDAEREGEAFALFNLDLDGFKQVNDRYGHQYGDEMLRKVSVLFSRSLTERHRLYRFGGDEFMLLERHATVTSAAGTANALISALVETPIQLLDRVTAPIGVSAGIVIASGGTERVESLLEASDLALYESKHVGGHTYHFYDAQLRTLAKRNRGLIRALPHALESGQIKIVYQPFFNAQSQKLCGFEVLVRWTHPEYGRIPADRLIRLAEEAGSIQELGSYVTEQACLLAREWPSDLLLSVNVSVGQLESKAFLPDLTRILQDTGFPASRLQIEVTESIFMEPDASTFTLLHSLRSQGIIIALDDFGKGFSSLGYLRFFPFSKIKLDALFVRDMLREPRAASIVRAVIELAIDLGVAVTAEGVETQEQLSYLTSLGCTEIQGYLLSHPLPPLDAMALLTRDGFPEARTTAS